MNDDKDSAQGEEMVAKLIAAAGKGRTASPEARQRIYSVVRSHWESEAKRRPAASKRFSTPRRRSQSFRATRVVAMAATVAGVALTFFLLQQAPEEAAVVARLARIDGSAELVRGDEILPLGSGADRQAIEVDDTIRTGSDGRIALRLEDGLSLRLNVDTELSFTETNELELRSGAVYIDSGRVATANDLRVQTPLGAVEHLGTQYELHVAGSQLRVRVREGRVAVQIDDVGEIGEAGEQIEFGRDGVLSRTSIAPNDPAWNWAAALATLPAAESYALGETLEWVARERGLTLEFENVSARQKALLDRVVGLQGLDSVETLAIIERTNGLRAEVEGARLIISD